MWNLSTFPRLFPLALSLSTKQGLLILKRTSVARSQKNKSWCVSCNLISNKTSNKTSCTTFNIRLKYLEMIINVISKISYKMITLTWYKSFKQNIIKINININLKHIRRTNYENINLLLSNFPCCNSRSMRINTSSIRRLL